MKKIGIMLLLTLVVSNSLKSDIRFLRGPLSEAVKKAEAEKKLVLIDFITDWCRWCDTLDARTYSDASVSALINKAVVPIKIDAEKGEGIAIAKRYDVHAYPTILLIKSNGEEIDRILGYVEARPFLSTLQDYVNGKNTIGVLNARLKHNGNDPALQYSLSRKYLDRNDMETAAGHYKKLMELDPKNKLGHNEEAAYNIAVASLRLQKDPVPLVAFVTSFPKTEMGKDALSTLWRFYTKAKDGENARRYFSQYIEQWPNDAGMMNNYAWGCAEQGINLEHAATVAKKAVELSTNNGAKASYLDTYATVEFAQGQVARAIALEQEALDLLGDISAAKKKPYEESMAKFRAADKAARTN
jgi:thioredoxin-related protein/putative hemolysin